MMEEEDQRILGIKAIAEYLETSERSVYRWEKELGLPLHRVSGAAGSTVFGYVGELQKWLRKRSSADTARLQSRKNRTLVIISVSSAILIVIAAAFFFIKNQEILSFFAAENPLTSITSGNIVLVRDHRGKDIWTFITSFEVVNPDDWWKTKCIDFLDIDGDGANEVVSRVYDMSKDSFFLTLFDNNGKTIWEKTVTNEQTYNGLLLKSNFLPVWIRFAHGDDGQYFIVAYWRHRARFLSLITSYSLQGELVHKYIHTGHLKSYKIFDWDNDGTDDILFTGTNNLLKGEGILGVLNILDFHGVCPPYRIEPEYGDLAWLKMYVPDNPERGNQLLYLRFKRNPYFEEKQRIYTFAEIQNLEEDLVHVQLFPFDLGHQDLDCSFEYIFDRNFELLHVIPNSAMLRFFPEIAKDSKTDILLSELTEAYSKNVLSYKDGNWISVAQIH